MNIEIRTEFTVGTLIDYRSNSILRVNHEYQRGLRWTILQKQMFIDSIFRGYSIPAFYFHKLHKGTPPIVNTYFDVVDGQQRIDAIYSFSGDGFPLLDPSDDGNSRFPSFVKNDPCPWAGRRFSELSEDLQEQLRSHVIVAYEITSNNENSIRDLFIRLQGGTPLTPQDKRDSWPGNFTEFVLKIGGKSGIDRWFGLPLFKEVSKVGNESRRRQLAAQVFMLFWEVKKKTKFCDIKSPNIDEFYHAQVGFDDKSTEARRFEKICKRLYEAFSDKPSIHGHYVIHLVLLVDSLLDEYASGWERRIAVSINEFERRRRDAASAVRNRESTEYMKYYEEYGRLTQTQSDIANTIRRRHAFFSEEMLKLLDLKKLDEKRQFTNMERRTVYFRDMELCQWCAMIGDEHRVSWDECQIHHVVPFGEGGSTIVDNGALVHKDCHPIKKEDVERFRHWWKNKRTAVSSETKKNGRSLLPPEGTIARFEYGGELFQGEIRDEKLVIEGNGAGSYQSFSQASSKLTNTSRNGWRDWELNVPGNHSWILAEDWRVSFSEGIYAEDRRK